MREAPLGGIVVVPPLLRQEVLDAVPSNGSYLHGYLLNSGFSEEIRSLAFPSSFGSDAFLLG